MKKQTTIKPLSEEYPELDKCAEIIEDITIREINKMAQHTESEMPYKSQCILEMVIAKLEECV